MRKRKTNTKLVAIGAVGTAAALGAALAWRRRHKSDVELRFDASDVRDITDIADQTDIEEPVIITEEVVVISDVPY